MSLILEFTVIVVLGGIPSVKVKSFILYIISLLVIGEEIILF